MVALLLVGGGCRGFHGEEERTAPRARVDASGEVALTAEEVAALGLATEAAESGSILTARTRFGQVVAQAGDDVWVTAPLPARLVDLRVSLGQTVEAGATLATLDPSLDAVGRADLAVRREALRGEQDAAAAKLHAAEVELRRVSKLVESGLATAADRARAEAAVASARARLTEVQHSDRTLRTYVSGHLPLTAPVDGVVVEVETTIGKLLPQGARVVRLLRQGPRWVDLAVPPEERTGTRYEIEACGDTLPARLAARGQVVHDGWRSDRLVVSASDSKCLAPGRFVAVAVRDAIAGVVIPRSAVVRQGTKWLAFVETRPHTFVPRPVRIAADDGRRVAIAEGLSAGEQVVTVGAAELLGEIGFTRPGALTPTGPSTAGGRGEP